MLEQLIWGQNPEIKLHAEIPKFEIPNIRFKSKEWVTLSLIFTKTSSMIWMWLKITSKCGHMQQKQRRDGVEKKK